MDDTSRLPMWDASADDGGTAGCMLEGRYHGNTKYDNTYQRLENL